MSNISNLVDCRTPTSNTKNSKVTNIRKNKDTRGFDYLTLPYLLKTLTSIDAFLANNIEFDNRMKFFASF